MASAVPVTPPGPCCSAAAASRQGCGSGCAAVPSVQAFVHAALALGAAKQGMVAEVPKPLKSLGFPTSDQRSCPSPVPLMSSAASVGFNGLPDHTFAVAVPCHPCNIWA